MFISLNWLNEYVEIKDLNVKELRLKMSAAGLSVERQNIVGEGIEHIVIGEITEMVKHPNSDHLWITKVRIGDESVLQIVTGAQNIAVGQKVPVIMPGRTLPGGPAIEVTTLRGVESQGMMCSAKELGIGESYEGILILDQQAPVGAKFAEYYSFPDTIFDIEITPNRGDLMSMVGIAREVSVLVNRPLKMPTLKTLNNQITNINNQKIHTNQITITKNNSLDLSVQIEDKSDCDRFAAVGLEGEFGVTTPFLIKQRLLSAGMRPISLLVDVSNYVMLELGQPNHAYDSRCVDQGAFYVRRAHFGEKLVLLDGSEVELEPHNLVISDREKILGLAGIMGSDASKIADNTNRICVEAAHFDGVVIRKTTMSKQVRSEASQRFERKVDAALPVLALERFYQLLSECTKVEVVGHLVDENHVQYADKAVLLRSRLLKTYLGKELAPSYVERVLNSLGFETIDATHAGEHGGWHVTVNVPSWRRNDVSIEEDLIEEVARIYGYNAIDQHTPKGSVPMVQKDPFVKNKRALLVTLAEHGWQELLTYSFTSADQITQAGYTLEQAVKVHNPLSVEQTYMRMSLLPNILPLVEKNRHLKSEMAVFECSRVYHQRLFPILPEEVVNESLEREHLAMVIWGQELPFEAAYQRMIGQLTIAFERMGVRDWSLCQNAAELNKSVSHLMFHPGRTAVVVVGETQIGLVGQIHPKYAQELNLPENILLAELDMADLLSNSVADKLYRPFSLYPKTTESLSFLMAVGVPIGAVIPVVRDVDALIQHVGLLPVYVGDGVPEGKKAVTLEVECQKIAGVISAEEVKSVRNKIVKIMQDRFECSLRV